MKISIIGTGIYSIALALIAARNNHSIMMWSENQNLINHFNENHDLKPLTDEFIPDNINISGNIEKVIKNADLIIIGTTAKYVRSVCENLKPYYKSSIPICIATKGIENDSCAYLSDIVKDILKCNHISVISGPTFAVDLINKDICAMTLASNSNEASQRVLKALKCQQLKFRETNDLYGTQICASLKNIFAIASGILNGLGYSESSQAFFITESFHDIKYLLEQLNCNSNTIMSYAGLGDLILTCSTPKSRNYKFGLLLGSKKHSEEITAYLKENTTEGYYTLISVKKLLNNKNISIPIIDIIYEIAVNHQNPETISNFLISKN